MTISDLRQPPLDGHRGPDQAFSSVTPAGPAARSGWEAPPPRKGFFTDTSICIGCKACEVACKEWNGLPQDGIFELLGSSYDNTGALGANTWRHVEFIEQGRPSAISMEDAAARVAVDLGMPSFERPGDAARKAQGAGWPSDLSDAERIGRSDGGPAFMPDSTGDDRTDFRWLMASNVCKHCTNAGCLDVCPTGALFRTEFGTVVVQEDICNGCGYCVGGCPFGVIQRRTPQRHASEDPRPKVSVPHVTARAARPTGVAQKCTLCYDRLRNDQTPACAQACPTQSIQFGDVDELRERAEQRVADLQAKGVLNAQLYAEDPDGGIGGAGAFFLLLDEPEVYGFPPDPVVTTADLPRMWRRAGMAALGLVVATLTAFAGRGRS